MLVLLALDMRECLHRLGIGPRHLLIGSLCQTTPRQWSNASAKPLLSTSPKPKHRQRNLRAYHIARSSARRNPLALNTSRRLPPLASLAALPRLTFSRRFAPRWRCLPARVTSPRQSYLPSLRTSADVLAVDRLVRRGGYGPRSVRYRYGRG